MLVLHITGIRSSARRCCFLRSGLPLAFQDWRLVPPSIVILNTGSYGGIAWCGFAERSAYGSKHSPELLAGSFCFHCFGMHAYYPPTSQEA